MLGDKYRYLNDTGLLQWSRSNSQVNTQHNKDVIAMAPKYPATHRKLEYKRIWIQFNITKIIPFYMSMA